MSKQDLSTNFYENVLNGEYDAYEKLASAEADQTLEALNGMSQEELDALAQELGAFSKEAEEASFSLEDEFTEGQADQSEELNAEMIKQACEEIESDLEQGGYSFVDYISSLTGTEKCAYEIAETCEKIATVCEIPRIVAAQDLIGTMYAKVEDAEAQDFE